MQDEGGAFPIFEAVLVAILIMGAIVFVSLTASPSQEEGAGGISMGRVASDTLAILQVRPSVNDQYKSALEEIIVLAMQGNTAQAEGFLREVLPRGTNFEMRLDNGVAPLGLLPHGRTASLRGADGDAVLMVAPAPWNNAPDPVMDGYLYFNHGTTLADAGGNVVDLTTCTNLLGPSGSPIGPGSQPWVELWLQWQDKEDSDGGTPNTGTVPAWAPYGWWRAEGTGCGIDWFRVVHPACTAGTHAEAAGIPVCLVERPVYGVQLLVWDGV